MNKSFKSIAKFFAVLGVFSVSLLWLDPAYGLDMRSHLLTLTEDSTAISQFAPNMRYPYKEISYRITNCPEKKVSDVESAFNILSKSTTLKFRAVDSGEEISVRCHPDIDKKPLVKEYGQFELGTGGPSYRSIENFNIIDNGKVYLQRDHACDRPLVELHEILHALGYDHSANSEDVMYSLLKCDQSINANITRHIDKIYSIPNLPDLVIKKAFFGRGGKGGSSLTLSLFNYGITEVEEFTLVISDVDSGKILVEKEFDGRGVYQRDINYTFSFNVRRIRVEVKTGFDELDKDNNSVDISMGDIFSR